MVPKFDIFFGRYRDGDAQWLECAEGLGMAYERMKELAMERPGPYFVFSCPTREVLASVDTTPSISEKRDIA